MLKFLKYALVLFLPLCATEEAPPYATCWIAGQLGNQMCQVATTLVYAWDNGLDPLFPQLQKTTLNTSFNRDNFFFRLNSSPLPREPKMEFQVDYWWQPDPIPPGEDVHLKGHYFNKIRYHHHLDKLREVFAPSKKVVKYLEQKYGWLIAHPNTCSVHVRTYNPELVKSHCVWVGLDYYREAMALLPPKTLFVVFSDRIQWCKQVFADFPHDIVFIEGNNHVQDFHLMQMMQDHIIGNSVFSWWTAYLDSKPNKKVIAPRQWFRFNKSILPFDDDTIFFPEWTLLDVPTDLSLPRNIRDFDPFSSSLDTQ